MDLDDFDMKQLLQAAIKSEIESKEVYLQLAGKVDNAFLTDKLKFIAQEEQKHRDYLESIYKMEMQQEVEDLPGESPVPLPGIDVDRPTVQASDIMSQAMDAEMAASDFYSSLSKRFDKEDVKVTLEYLSKMEIGHYKLLEIEKEVLENEEDYEIEWEMMHLGP